MVLLIGDLATLKKYIQKNVIWVVQISRVTKVAGWGPHAMSSILIKKIKKKKKKKIQAQLAKLSSILGSKMMQHNFFFENG